MTKRMDPEIKVLRAAGMALEKLPKDAQFRTLAYLVARTANVGSCAASDWLYACSRRERELAGHVHTGRFQRSDGQMSWPGNDFELEIQNELDKLRALASLVRDDLVPIVEMYDANTPGEDLFVVLHLVKDALAAWEPSSKVEDT